MSNNVKVYVDLVLEKISADSSMRRRIEKDLTSHINEISSEESLEEIIDRMGQPEDVAKEFMDNIYDDKEAVMDRLIQERAYSQGSIGRVYEYKSKTTLMGLPLVHIKTKRAYGGPVCVAKGIIAIGDIAIGAVAIGGFALGGFTLGGISLGILALGGISIGLLLAIGGFALGCLAIGGFALGMGAIGGAAFGKIAYGGFAKGVVAIGGKATGDYIITGIETGMGSYSLGHVSKQEIADLIRMAYPNISSWVIKLFTVFGA